MDYDFRKSGTSYEPYRGGQSHPTSYYPRINQHPPRPIVRAAPAPPPSSTPSGLGIRVTIKPECRITPPPALSPQIAEVPRSTFQFNFDFERKILAEVEKDNQNWSSIIVENESSSSSATETATAARISDTNKVSANPMDQLVNKYVALGLNSEAVTLALKNYGDNSTKVQEFVESYNHLREMGFAANTVAGVLAMYDNDMKKAVEHFLNSS